AGVDIELRRTMWQFLQELIQQGTTIILTTHYLEEAEMLCRNIGIIQQGRFVVDTSMKSLLSTLETETFILDLAHSVSEVKLSDYAVKIVDPVTLVFEVHREQGLNGLFLELAKQHIRVLSLRDKAKRLEELFGSLALNNCEADKAKRGQV